MAHVFYEDETQFRWPRAFSQAINVTIFINIIFNLISGYHHAQIKEAVLEPKRIAVNYLKTYFAADCICLFPSTLLAWNAVGKAIGVIPTLFLYFRVPTMYKYLRHITVLMRLSDTQHEIVSLISLSIYMLHWCSCFLASVDYIYVLLGDTNESWFRHANLTGSNVTVFERYMWSLQLSIAHFYSMEGEIFPTHSKFDYVTLSLIAILGSAFFGYVIVIILQAIGTVNAAESKYEELLRQLYEYLRSKRVPVNINKRLTRYCEYRFQKRYFRTEAILATLSEHLQNEIKLYTMRNLIGKVEIFKGLPKGLIGSIIASLNTEIYLKNDVVVSAHKPLHYWYIISHGTVAMIHTSGIELCHLEDGEVFGGGRLMDVTDFPVNVVALEISEIFRMTKQDFLSNMKNRTIYERLMDQVDKRQEILMQALSKQDPKLQEKTEILFEVKKGNILESGLPRAKFGQDF
nr:potassium/sodium hyperpolarization-activated cyclic nucleotide-gated channel 4-like [Onthophagus taurus]